MGLCEIEEEIRVILTLRSKRRKSSKGRSVGAEIKEGRKRVFVITREREELCRCTREGERAFFFYQDEKRLWFDHEKKKEAVWKREEQGKRPRLHQWIYLKG